MEVWDKDSFGHIAFDDESMGYSHLGHIVENAVIHHALWQKAQQCSDVTLMAPAQIQQVAWGENEAFITLQEWRHADRAAGGRCRRCQLLAA
jgi:2-octaprenylphenol hydroxylase